MKKFLRKISFYKRSDFVIAILLFFPWLVSLVEVILNGNIYYLAVNILYVIASVLKEEYDLVVKCDKELDLDHANLGDDPLQKISLPLNDEKFGRGSNRTSGFSTMNNGGSVKKLMKKISLRRLNI